VTRAGAILLVAAIGCRKPEQPPQLLAQGLAADQAGHTREAERLYRRALNHADTETAFLAHYDLGSMLLREHRFDTARGELQVATKLRPGEFRGWYNLGLCEAAAARYADAIAPLQQAVKIDPRHAGARFNLGFVLWRAGRRDEALPQWDQTLVLDPSLSRSVDRLLGRAPPPHPTPP
jgi:tetratricopeptide (TPR) repeat protein